MIVTKSIRYNAFSIKPFKGKTGDELIQQIRESCIVTDEALDLLEHTRNLVDQLNYFESHPAKAIPMVAVRLIDFDNPNLMLLDEAENQFSKYDFDRCNRVVAAMFCLNVSSELLPGTYKIASDRIRMGDKYFVHGWGNPSAILRVHIVKDDKPRLDVDKTYNQPSDQLLLFPAEYLVMRVRQKL